MQRWDLWIDESGDFGNPSDTVVVAGLLRQGDFDGRAARACVEAATPGVPWPPHAAWLHPLTMQLVYAQRARVSLAAGHALLALRSRLPNLLDALSHHATTGAALPPGTFDRLRAADRIVREADSRLARRLEERRDAMAVGIGAGLRSLAVGEGGIETYWVAATEPLPGAAGAAQRYSALLDLVLQRTHDLLAGVAGPHELRVHVLRRPGLDATRLASVVAGLRAHPFGPEAARVHVTSGLRDFDENVSAWGVLVDFTANTFRRLLARSDAVGLMDLETQALNRLRVTSARLADALPPHLGFLGGPQAAIEAARAGELTAARGRLHAASSDPRWAVEQAAAWVDAWS